MDKYEEVWLRAWLAVAGTFNSKASDCTRYADACLRDFQERFPLPEQDA